MPTHGSRRIDQDIAERLLAGDVPAGARTEADPLIDHLAALAAPASPDELAGEARAREAFRAGFQARDPAPRRTRRRTGTLAKLLTLKVAIATVISATTLGGVALAANTSVLPAPFRPPAKTKTTPPRPASESEAGPETRRPQPAPPGPAGTPSLADLCRAYQKAGGDPAPAPLIAAAGDRKKVADYCRTLLDAKPGPGAKPGPADPAGPGGRASPPAPPPTHPKADKAPAGPVGPRLKP